MSHRRRIDESISECFDVATYELSSSDISLVVIRDGKVVKTCRGRGVRPFYDLITTDAKIVSGAVIGDRVVGRAVALLSIYAEVVGVFSPMMSTDALALLEGRGIAVSSEQEVPYIKGQEGEKRCIFEEMLKDVDDPKTAFIRTKRFFTKQED